MSDIEETEAEAEEFDAEADTPAEGDRYARLTPEQRAWRDRATKLAHEYGDRHGHCAAFDKILYEVGLPVRDDPGVRTFIADQVTYNYLRYQLEVPDNEPEHFEAWKRAAGRHLLRSAEDHGLKSHLDVMREAGFEVPVATPVIVRGQFEFPMTAMVVPGEDVITGLDPDEVRLALRQRVRAGKVDWKVEIDRSGEGTPAGESQD